MMSIIALRNALTATKNKTSVQFYCKQFRSADENKNWKQRNDVTISLDNAITWTICIRQKMHFFVKK